MLYISTSKIHKSTVGASFTVSFSVAPDEIDYLTALHEKYSEMNMCGFTIEPSDSEKPNNCDYAENPSGDAWECSCYQTTICEHQKEDFNPDGTINIVECVYEPKTEPQTEEWYTYQDEQEYNARHGKE